MAAAATAACRGDRGAAAARVPGDEAPHLTVEVLNAGGRPGSARLATRVLRRAGIDVVAFGNANPDEPLLDSTRIVVRRGGVAVGVPIRDALGVGQVIRQPDSTRLLDASVLLGSDFAPRLEFHP